MNDYFKQPIAANFILILRFTRLATVLAHSERVGVRRLLGMIASISCLALAACDTTTAEMRADAREKDTVHVALPYLVAYHNFIRRAGECNHQGTPVSYFYVEWTEKISGKSGLVEVIQNGLLRAVMISADIVAVSDGTDISYYVNHRFAVFRDFHPIIREWAMGTGTDCGGLFD
ncbi:MAG: hypothetical protein WCF16_06455 [Alphaproteobacteria bacterium]